MNVPENETRRPIQSRRKLRWRRAISMETRRLHYYDALPDPFVPLWAWR
jgi:hypothetical protein